MRQVVVVVLVANCRVKTKEQRRVRVRNMEALIHIFLSERIVAFVVDMIINCINKYVLKDLFAEPHVLCDTPRAAPSRKAKRASLVARKKKAAALVQRRRQGTTVSSYF